MERCREQKRGRKMKGGRVDIGRIWRGVEAWKEEERMESGYWEDLERSRVMEGRGKDGEWILGGFGEEQKHGRKRKGWRVDIGRIWRGVEAWRHKVSK